MPTFNPNYIIMLEKGLLMVLTFVGALLFDCCLLFLSLCRTKEMIIKAINDNDFLRNLEKVQINEIVDCMYQREFTREQYVCREGGVGTQLYVISCKLTLAEKSNNHMLGMCNVLIIVITVTVNCCDNHYC